MLQTIKSKSRCTSGDMATFVIKWRKCAVATPASCVVNSLVMLITAMQIASSDETPSSQLTISAKCINPAQYEKVCLIPKLFAHMTDHNNSLCYKLQTFKIFQILYTIFLMVFEFLKAFQYLFPQFLISYKDIISGSPRILEVLEVSGKRPNFDESTFLIQNLD